MKKINVFLSGIIVGAIIFGATYSFATTGTKSVEALYSNIKIVVNGSLIQASQEPFAVEGRVYVPLRAVADALKQEVSWENNTVLIGTGRQSLLLIDIAKPTLVSIKSGDKSMYVKDNNVYGFHVTGIKARDRGSLSFFVQNKGIKQVNGQIALDDANSDDVKPVEIIAMVDNKEVWSGTVEKGQDPVKVSIMLDNSASNVKFELYNLDQTKVDFIDFNCQY